MITVFTPTYNRGHLLNRLYESLIKQRYKSFEWIIVDDGSTDGTQNVVSSLILGHDNLQGGFPIRYFKKENGGKHTAINLGVEYAEGELFFIADSDDFLPKDSLQIVHEEWSKIKHDDTFLGVCGIDADLNGKIIGSGLPKEYIDCHAWDLSPVYKVTGDLKEVFRTDVLRLFPFPEIKGEKFCPEVLVWFRMARNYKMRIPFKDKLRNAINYWRFRFCLTIKNKAGVSPNEVDIPKISRRWYFLAPIGYLMHLKDKRNI